MVRVMVRDDSVDIPFSTNRVIRIAGAKIHTCGISGKSLRLFIACSAVRVCFRPPKKESTFSFTRN